MGRSENQRRHQATHVISVGAAELHSSGDRSYKEKKTICHKLDLYEKVIQRKSSLNLNDGGDSANVEKWASDRREQIQVFFA